MAGVQSCSAPTQAPLEQELQQLLTALLDSQAQQSFEELAAVDLRLRELLASADFLSRAMESESVLSRVADILRQIGHAHGALLGAASERQRAIGETLQQLHHDQRSANAYERVRRHSLHDGSR